MIARLFALALVVSTALAVGGTAIAAEAVTVRGGVHADYGRLVFDWQTPVGYSARLEGDRLVVTFDRPARFDLADAEKRLFRYLDGVEAGPDGRSLTLDLKSGYGLNGFMLGPKVVLDLVHGGAGGTAGAAANDPAATDRAATDRAAQAASAAPAASLPPAPSATSQPPTAAASLPQAAVAPPPAPAAQAAALAEVPPEIRVRVGEHADFERLVFDWPQPVGFETLGADDAGGVGTTIVFDRPARLDVSALQADPPSLLRRFADTRVDGRLRVDLQLAPGSRVRTFADGPRVVVDLLQPGAAPLEGEPETAASEGGAAQEAGGALQQAAAPTPLLPAPPVQAAGTTDGPDPAAEPAAAPSPETAPAPAPAPASTPTPSPQSDSAAAPAAPPAFVTREPLERPENRPVPGTPAPDTPTLLLRFAWPEGTGAVALRRGGNLLIGFDGKAPVDLAASLREVAPELGAVVEIPLANGTLLSLAEAPLTAVRMWRAEPGWLVEFRRSGMAPLGDPPVLASAADGTVRVAVDLPRNRLVLNDPAGGGTLVLIPLPRDGQGMGNGRDYPTFRLLPTAQGLAILPHIEPLEIALAADGVTMAVPDGTLSSTEAAMRAPALLDAVLAPRLFDLETWRHGTLAEFNDQRQALQRAVVEAAQSDSGLARLELARFYFAHGLGSEALGVLSLMQRENEELRDDPELLLLRAASRLLVGDHANAQELLAEPTLLAEPEADLWRAALAAEAQDWPAAAALFARHYPLIADYARPVRVRLALAAAEATLEAGDLGAAAERLEQAESDLSSDLERARHDFLSALLLKAEGDMAAALPILERLAASGQGAPSVQARLAMIDLKLEAGDISPGEAIEQLEQLRFAWRGDAFEFALLQRLAALYEQEGRWREALRSLRQAATYFPGSERAEAAADQLSRLFARAFLGPDKPDIPPLTALSLYEEFRELTPPGDAGNRLIEGLADRLVAVDLLDRAATLLEGQIQFRLAGEEKARVGARLALVRLLDREPRAALEALEISAQPELSEEVERQRRHLEARALSDLGRANQALVLLQGDGSLDAQRLRAEILWAERDWPAAATALAASLPEQPGEGALTPEVSGQILNLAVAHTLANDRTALQSLRGVWGESMAVGPHAEAFALLAEDLDPASVATIAQQLAQVDRVQAFMANYRERLRETQLSDLN